jgi:hypothetical protein
MNILRKAIKKIIDCGLIDLTIFIFIFYKYQKFAFHAYFSYLEWKIYFFF